MPPATRFLGRSPARRTAYDQVGAFAEILTQRRGRELHVWLRRIDTDGAPPCDPSPPMNRDLDAVTAALTLPYSSGSVQGAINHIKMIKRQMFNRANIDLLRKRVLLAT